MLYITDKVVAAGRLADVITMASVVDMLSVVAMEFGGARNSHRILMSAPARPPLAPLSTK